MRVVLFLALLVAPVLGAPAGDATAGDATAGEPTALSAHSPLAHEAAATAIQALNVQLRRHCPEQTPFAKPMIHSASEAVVGDAVGVQLRLLFDDKSSAYVLVGRTAAHKLFLFSASPAACEMRLPLMRAMSATSIEKHNANPARTFDRVIYKQFEGLTDTQLAARFLGSLDGRQSDALRPLEKSTPPTSWRCSSSWYGAHDGCDCDCGAHDPDCDDARSHLYCHGGGEPTTSRCSAQSHVCEADVPTWVCTASWFGARDGCDCGCGDWDPDCDVSGQILYCHDGAKSIGRTCDRAMRTCSLQPAASPPPLPPPPAPSSRVGSVPSSWTCSLSYYAMRDGCDCSCGAWDPDCDTAGQTLYCNDGQSSTSRACNTETLRCSALTSPSPPPPSPSPPGSPPANRPDADAAMFDMRHVYEGRCSNAGRVKSQGSCGSCWAFAAVTAFQDRFCYASSGAVRPQLSVQEVVSCARKYTHGCNGGYAYPAYRYMREDGVVTDSTLPYTSGSGSRSACPANLGQHSKWHTEVSPARAHGMDWCRACRAPCGGDSVVAGAQRPHIAHHCMRVRLSGGAASCCSNAARHVQKAPL